MSLACLRDESFTDKSPWLLAAARRASACSLPVSAMAGICEGRFLDTMALVYGASDSRVWRKEEGFVKERALP